MVTFEILLQYTLVIIAIILVFNKTVSYRFIGRFASGQRHLPQKRRAIHFLPPKAACHSYGTIKWANHFIKKKYYRLISRQKEVNRPAATERFIKIPYKG